MPTRGYVRRHNGRRHGRHRDDPSDERSVLRRKRTNNKGLAEAELREQASAELATAEAEARRVLEAAADAAERLERQADNLEWARRVEARRTEVIRKAAQAAQLALDAREASDAAGTEAEQHAARRAHLEADLRAQEAARRARLVEIEQATASGDVARALELEKTLADDNPDRTRAEVAVVLALEAEARDRAAQAHSAAEQHAAAAAAWRHALEVVEEELRSEYDQRREKRAQDAALRLFAFDHREWASAAALAAGAVAAAPPTPAPDSADDVMGGISIVTDQEGRLQGVTLPLQQ